MEQYFVEGLYVTGKGLKRSKKSGKVAQADIELFAKTFWANNPEEANRSATEALNGGQWVEGPKVSKTSEEKRMRALGAPELPGLTIKKPRKRSSR